MFAVIHCEVVASLTEFASCALDCLRAGVEVIVLKSCILDGLPELKELVILGLAERVSVRVFGERTDLIIGRAVEELCKRCLADDAVEVIRSVCAGVVDDFSAVDVDSVMGVESAIDTQHVAVMGIGPAMMA